MLPARLACLCEIAPWTRVRAHLLALLGAGLLTLSACGGGGGGGSAGGNDDDTAACTSSTCGEIVIGLTDADGDFLSYAVDVVSIELEKANGAVVETLPTRQRVDFADLVDVTELVTSATVPNGVYVRATVRLDYSTAEVTVEQGGLPVEATVVDAGGAALGVVDVELTLDNANHVAVAPGVPALLQLDFDLAATHEVDLTTVPATATADPVLVASIEPLDAREFRVRGPLVSVDETAGSYLIDLRPFNHPSARLGRLEVLTTADTRFEVDGVALDQAAALAAMAALGANAPTAAHGVYDVEAREFTADRVLAGDSVPGVRFDGVIGNVMARSTDTLTVRGGTFVRTDGGTRFARGEITVLLGPDTLVTQDGGGGAPLGLEAISIGQRIHALGEASGSDDGPTLDATAGRVRLHLTHVSGAVVDALPGQVTVDLFAIDGRDPMAFDFAGTGVAPASDADPDAYEIATGVLDVTAFTAGDPMRAFGFVAPFGAAPPDFEGRTLVSFDALRALLGVGWGLEGTTAPFLSMGADGFVLDPANAALGLRHHLKVGPWVQDITLLASPVTIAPATEGRTLYAVARFRRVEMYRDFAEFADRVAELLGSGAAMHGLHARGQFDAGATTLAANYVAVSFTAP
jgi:hypothetical protein